MECSACPHACLHLILWKEVTSVHCTISYEFLLSLPIESINLFFILFHFVVSLLKCFSAIFVFFDAFYSFAESREMLYGITFDLMEAKNFNGVVVGCGDASNDFFILKKLTFVRPVDSQSLRKNENNKNHKVNHSLGFIPTLCVIRSGLDFFFFFSCLASTFCTNTTNVRATDALFAPLSLSIFFIVFNLFCHLSSVVFSNATNEIQFGGKPFFSGINEIDFKHKKAEMFDAAVCYCSANEM